MGPPPQAIARLLVLYVGAAAWPLFGVRTRVAQARPCPLHGFKSGFAGCRKHCVCEFSAQEMGIFPVAAGGVVLAAIATKAKTSRKITIFQSLALDRDHPCRGLFPKDAYFEIFTIWSEMPICAGLRIVANGNQP